MTWDEYVDQCVKELAEHCRDVDDFRAVIGKIEKQLAAAGADVATRKWFWGQVSERYENAPKLMLKEATAAQKLYVLHTLASQMLAAAQQQSVANAAAAAAKGR